MKISELSAQTSVPVATIKYYLREGLLPPGKKTGPNQAIYGERHVRRLVLVRTLREVGELPIEAIHRITMALDQGSRTFELEGQALDAVSSPRSPGPPLAQAEGHDAATAEVDRLIAALGWDVRSDAPARQSLVLALARVRADFLPRMDAALLIPYATTIDELVRMENLAVAARFAESPERAIETAVLGTVLVEPMLLSLRRLAHEHYAGARGAESPGQPGAGG